MGALRKPGPLAFPPAGPAEPEDHHAPLPAGPVLLTRLEPPASFASRSVPGARILPLRPYAVEREPAPLPSPRIAPSFRDLMIFAACAIAIAVLMAFVLASVTPRPATLRPAATPLQRQADAVHPAKPSAYGEAFPPPRPAPRSHSAAAATAAPPASPTPATPSR